MTALPYTPPSVAVQPGDWFVVDPSGTEAVFAQIERGERLAEWAQHVGDKRWHPEGRSDDWWHWGHAGVATRWTDADPATGLPWGLRRAGEGIIGTPTGRQLLIAEAEPGGAVERPWHWEASPHVWSTGTGLSVPAMGPAARRYTMQGPWGDHGVPYAFADYAAIAAKALHLPWPGLDAYMASVLHMICSQLTDQAAQDKDVHLFDDGRPPGYVMPLDLALLLAAKGVPVNASRRVVSDG